jgi:hypothetical protein
MASFSGDLLRPDLSYFQPPPSEMPRSSEYLPIPPLWWAPASINDLSIHENARLFHWDIGTRRPDEHPGLGDLNL